MHIINHMLKTFKEFSATLNERNFESNFCPKITAAEK